MRVVHEPAGGGERVLASDVDVADTALAKSRGLMFRSDVPDDYALVFEFDDGGRRFVHMLFVRQPLDVLWLADDRVERTATLQPWRGVGWAPADRLIELPAGAASDVAAGDRVRVDGTADG